ncbi:hypothetical protein HZB89_01425 [archaeon]|nr:hypothetical protein [archaeon]
MDLAKEQELSFAVMNLIALEEHLAFTAAKTGRQEYIDFLNDIRKVRSKYLKDIVSNDEGEAWCISKHLLVTVMRLTETAIKYGAEGNKKKAMELLSDAIDAYQAFWVFQKIGSKK